MVMFNSEQFVSYIFALLFLMLCCLWSMLYSHKAAGYVVGALLRLFVLPRGSVVVVGGVSFAPIQQRVFFKDVSYVTPGGMSFSCIDGHLTFNLRGFGITNNGRIRLRPCMCHDGLVGHTVRVQHHGVWRDATVTRIVKSDNASAPLHVAVRLSPVGTSDDVATVRTPNKNSSSVRRPGSPVEAVAGTAASRISSPSRDVGGGGGQHAGSLYLSGSAGGNGGWASEEVIVLSSDAEIAVKPSRVRLHVNGLGMCLFHNKGKYDDIEELLNRVLPTDVRNARAMPPSASRGGRGGGGTAEPQNTNQPQPEPQPVNAGAKGGLLTAAEVEKRRADKHRSASTIQQLMKFLSSIDVQLYASHIDLGALESRHPYFLHFGFERADISYFLTAAEADYVDLHRHVVECVFESVDLRWAPLDINLKAREDNAAYMAWKEQQRGKISHMRRFKERAQLMFQGTTAVPPTPATSGAASTALGSPVPTSAAPSGHMPAHSVDSDVSMRGGMGGGTTQHPDSGNNTTTIDIDEEMADVYLMETPSQLVRQYGTILEGGAGASLRVVYYFDSPGICASERMDAYELFPKHGLDVELRAKTIQYGPWSNYSRAQLQQHFLPSLFAPLSLPKWILGEDRPTLGMEISFTFLEECSVMVPFKWKATAPNLPYGLRDSGRAGSLELVLGAGSSYILKPCCVHPNPQSHTGQLFGITESFFEARDCKLFTSLHGGRSLLLDTAALSLHYDIMYPQYWHWKSEANTLVKLCNTRVFYYAEHIALFQALTVDWSYVPQMYSGESLASAQLHNKEAMIDRFTPSLTTFEVFFEDRVEFILNANPDNVMLTSDATSVEENNFVSLSAQEAHIHYAIPSDTYYIGEENEQLHRFEVAMNGLQLWSSVPAGHPMHSPTLPTASEEEPTTAADDTSNSSSGGGAGERIAIGSMSIHGTYAVMTQNLTFEQAAARVPTNTTPGRAALCNSMKLTVAVERVSGIVEGTLLTHLTTAWDNLFGGGTTVISPEDLFWMTERTKLPPANRVGLLLSFLQRGEPRANELEMAVTVAVRDVDVLLSGGLAAETRSPMRGGGGGSSDQRWMKEGVSMSLHGIEFSYSGDITVSEMSVVTTPIMCKWGSRVSTVRRRAATTTVADGGGGTVPEAVSLSSSLEPLSLQSTSEGVRQSTTLPPLPLRQQPRRPATSAATADHSSRNGPQVPPWCQSDCQSIAIGAIHFGKVSHVGPLPHFVTFHGVTEVSVDRVTLHLSGETATKMGTCLLRVAHEMKLQDPNRVRALAEARDIADSLHDALSRNETAATLNDFGGGENVSRRRAPLGTPSSSIFVRKGRLNARGASKAGGAAGKHAVRSAYRCSVLDIAETTQSAFEQFLEQRQKALDESIDLGVFSLRVNVESLSANIFMPLSQSGHTPHTINTNGGEHAIASLVCGRGLHLASSTLNDTNSNKRLSAAAPDVHLRIMLPKTQEMITADVGGDMIEVVSLKTSVCCRQTTAYPHESGAHQGLMGHFARQAEFLKYCDYQHLVQFSHESVFPHAMTTSAQSAMSRRSIFVGTNSSAAAAGDTRGEVVPDEAVGGGRRLTRAEVAAVADVASYFTTALGAYDAASGSRSPSAKSGSSNDDANHGRDGTGANGLASQSSKAFLTCQSAVSESSTQDRHMNPSRRRSSDGGVDALFVESEQGEQNENLTDLFDESEDDRNSDSGTPMNSDSGRGGHPFLSQGHRKSFDGAFGGSPASVQLRPALHLYRCHVVYEVVMDVQQSTLEGYSHTAVLPSVRRAQNNFTRRDYSKFHAHLPSVRFILHDEKAGEGANSRAASPRNLGGGHQSSPRPQYDFAEDYDATLNSLSSETGEGGDAEGLLGSAWMAWSDKPVENSRRARDGSTTVHYHIETPTSLCVFACADGVATLMQMQDQLRSQWMANRNAYTAACAPSLAPSQQKSSPVNTTAKTAKKRKTTSRSRTRSRVKQWSFSDDIVSVCIPCLEAKWLSHHPVHDDSLPPHVNVAALPTGRPIGVYTTTFALRTLQLVGQRTSPPQRFSSTNTPTAIAVKYGGSFCVASIALFTQINYEPLVRMGALRVDVPLIAYPKSKDHILVSYATNISVRVKKDFVGENQGTVCRGSLESWNTVMTRDIFEFVKHVNAGLGATHGAGSQASTPDTSGGRSSAVLWSDAPHEGGASDEEDVEVMPPEATTRFASIIPRDVSWQVQGSATVQNAIRFELVDVTASRSCLQVLVDRPSVIQMIRPTANFKLTTAAAVSGRNPPLRAEILSDVQYLQVKTHPTLLHFLLAMDTGDSSPTTAAAAAAAAAPVVVSREGIPAVVVPAVAMKSRAGPMVQSDTTPVDLATTMTGDATPKPAASVRNESIAWSTAPAAALYQPALLLTASVLIRNVDMTLIQSPSNYFQLIGRQWSCCMRTCEQEVYSPQCNSVSNADLANEGVGADPSLWSTDVKAVRAMFSKNVLLTLCRRAQRQRLISQRRVHPPKVGGKLRLHASATIFSELALIQYIAELCLPTTGSASGNSPAPSVAASQRQRDTNSVVGFTMRNISIAVHQSVQHSATAVPQNVAFASVQGVTLKVPYRPQAVEVIQPQLEAFVAEWATAVDTYMSETARRTEQRHRHGTGFVVDIGGAAGGLGRPPREDPLAQKVRLRGGTPTPTVVVNTPRSRGSPRDALSSSDVRPKESPPALSVHVELKKIEVTVGLPQDANVRLDVPQVSILLKHCAPRMLLKARVHPFVLTTRSGRVGRSLISFPAVYVDYGVDAEKSNVSVLMENFEAVLDPPLMNHVLMTYEKLVTELAGIVAKSSSLSAGGAEGGFGLDAGDIGMDTAEVSYFDGHPLKANRDAPQQQYHPEGSVSAMSRRPRPAPLEMIVPPATPKSGPGSAISTVGKNSEGPRRSFATFSVRGIRLSLVTSMVESRFVFQQLDATQEKQLTTPNSTANDSARTAWYARCLGLRLAVVDRDDYNRQQAALGGGPTPLGVSSRGSADGSVRGGGAAGGLLGCRPLGGYIWGMAEVSFHVKGEESPIRLVCTSNHPNATSRGSNVLGASKSRSKGSSGRQQQTPPQSPPQAVIVTTQKSDRSLAMEVVLFTPLFIARPGLPHHVHQAMREANAAVAEMRQHIIKDSLELRNHLQTSKTYHELLDQKRKWSRVMRMRSHAGDGVAANASQQHQVLTSPSSRGGGGGGGTSPLPADSSHRPSTTAASGSASNAAAPLPIRRKRDSRALAIGSPPTASSSSASFVDNNKLGPPPHVVITSSIKRMTIKADIRNLNIIVPCGESAFRVIMEGHLSDSLFSTQATAPMSRSQSSPVMTPLSSLSHLRQRFVPVIALKVFLRAVSVNWDQRTLEVQTRTVAGAPLAAAVSGDRSGFSSFQSLHHSRPSTATSSGERSPPTDGVQSDASRKEEDGSARDHIDATLKLDDLNIFFSHGTPFANVTHIQQTLSKTGSILGGLGVLTDTDPVNVTRERNRSYDRLHIESVVLPLSAVRLLPPPGDQAADNDMNSANQPVMERYKATLNISGPEIHLTSRCSAMLSELTSDLSVPEMPTVGPSSPTVSTRSTAGIVADDSAVSKVLEATNDTVAPRRSIEALGTLEPGKIIFYTRHGVSSSGANAGGADAAATGGRGGASMRGGSSQMATTSGSTLGVRRVSFVHHSDPTTGPSSVAASVVDEGPFRGSLEKAAVEVMAVPLPSATVSIATERGGGVVLPDNTAVRITIQCKRIEIDPVIAMLWQEAQIWVRIHQTEARENAQSICNQIEAFARSAARRRGGGTAGLPSPSANGSAGGGIPPTKNKTTGAPVAGSTPASSWQAPPSSPQTTAAWIVDQAIPIPTVFVAELKGIHWKRQQQNQSAADQQPLQPSHAASPATPMNTVHEFGAMMEEPNSPTQPKPSSFDVHMNLTGLRIDMSTVSSSNAKRSNTGGGNVGAASNAAQSNTFAALLIDPEGSLDVVAMWRQSMPAVNASSLGSPTKTTVPTSRQQQSPEPSMLVIITANRLRFECQNKIEVKSLEMFLPQVVMSISTRQVSMASKTAHSGDTDMLRRRGSHGSMPTAVPTSSASLPALTSVAEVTTISVHVPGDDPNSFGTAGGGDQTGNTGLRGNSVAASRSGPQMTVRAQHLNQLILVVMHWKKEWDDARTQAMRLFRISSATTNSATGITSGPSTPVVAVTTTKSPQPAPVPARKRGISLQRRSRHPLQPGGTLGATNRGGGLDLLSTFSSFPDVVLNETFNATNFGAATFAFPDDSSPFPLSPQDALEGSGRPLGHAESVLPVLSILQCVVLVGKSNSYLDLGAGNKHEFGVGGMRVFGRRICYESLETLSEGFAEVLDSRIRSDGVLSGSNTISKIGLTGFLIVPPHEDELLIARTTAPPESQPYLDPHRAPLRSCDGRTKRIHITVDELNLHFKERQIRDVAMFSIESLSLNAMDAFESKKSSATADGAMASSGRGRQSPNHSDKSEQLRTEGAAAGESAAALVSMDVQRCLMGITPQTSASFLGVATDVSTIVKEQQRIAVANMGGLGYRRNARTSSGDGDTNNNKAGDTAAVTAAVGGDTQTTILPQTHGDGKQHSLSTSSTPLHRVITSGQVSLSFKYTTVMIGSIIDARYLREDAAATTALHDCVTLRVPELGVTFAQAVVANAEVAQDGKGNTHPSQADSNHDEPRAAEGLLSRWWPWRRSTKPKEGEVDRPPAGASTASTLLTTSSVTPSRELFGDGGVSTMAATSSRVRRGSPPPTPPPLAQHFHHDPSPVVVRKFLLLSVEQVELTRQQQDKRALILAFRGTNIIEFYHETTLTIASQQQKVVAPLESLYSLMLRQTHPWTGSPRFEDFQAMADVIRTFTNPQNAAVLDDFATLRRNMYGEGQQRVVVPPLAASVPQASTSSPPMFTLIPLDRKRSRFAPQLRFGRDVSVNLETILSWLGTREEMIPETLFSSVCCPLERVMAVVEGCKTIAETVEDIRAEATASAPNSTAL